MATEYGARRGNGGQSSGEGVALAGYILGILGIPFCLTLILPILAIILGSMGKKSSEASKARAAIILGTAGLSIALILGVLSVSLPFIVGKIALQSINDRMVGARSESTLGEGSLPLPEPYWDVPPEYRYFSGIPEIRALTRDDPPDRVEVKILIGHDEPDEGLEDLLVAREAEICDFLRAFFSSKSQAELSPMNEDRIKVEIMDKLNKKLGVKGIQDILFDTYDVMN